MLSNSKSYLHDRAIKPHPYDYPAAPDRSAVAARVCGWISDAGGRALPKAGVLRMMSAMMRSHPKISHGAGRGRCSVGEISLDAKR
jgi:hypothetical protein